MSDFKISFESPDLLLHCLQGAEHFAYSSEHAAAAKDKLNASFEARVVSLNTKEVVVLLNGMEALKWEAKSKGGTYWGGVAERLSLSCEEFHRQLRNQ